MTANTTNDQLEITHNSTYSNFHSVVLAVEDIWHRLCRIDIIYDLLEGMESGDINFDDDITGGVTLRTIVVESLEAALSGYVDDCSEVMRYLEAQGGEPFMKLVENAKGADLTVPSPESGRMQS
ncbi:MAG: hypothetical protein KZQ96_23010 [Candidatus Thiodiazotropha sp. (ex Lucinoma borealis)]|nr:hypothetical protein [Candidatus Thiodiazotropha sp. (ex Lucinoma borealis)]